MRVKRENPEKLVNAVTNGDPDPTWVDRLKNQMGYAGMSSLADKIHGKHPNRGVEDAKQILSDLGVKKYTERDGGEAEEDRQNGKSKFT